MTLISFPSMFGKSTAGALAPAAVGTFGTVAGDWKQQELADLYRVEALLVQANMGVETERGTTDEGEPWFVFCRPDGEVFVHLCRMDGQYLLDSPGLDTPLRGSDFAGLIDQFVRSVAARTATSNVVQFRKARHDSVVRLHPAIMMAALIWSLYLASDHLMETAQAAEFDVDEANAGTVFGFASGEDPNVAVAKVEAFLAGNDNSEARLVLAGGRDGEGRGLINGTVAASLAATLTAIAVTYGLVEQRHIEAELGRAAAGEFDGVVAAQSVDGVDIVLAAAGDFDSDAPILLQHETGPIVLDGLFMPTLGQMAADVLAMAQSMQVIVDAATVGAPLRVEALPAVLTAEALRQHEFHMPVAALADVRSVGLIAANGPEMKALVAIAEKQIGSLVKYSVGDKIVAATFDITDFEFRGQAVALTGATQALIADNGAATPVSLTPADADSLIMAPVDFLDGIGVGIAPDIGTSNTSANNTGLANYDITAKAFVNFMLHLDSVEMIKLDNAVILMDTTAIDQNTDRYSSKSWIVDDNMTITVVGHQQDFLSNGLFVWA